MSSRYCKKLPEFVYFIGESEWISGPFVAPKRGCNTVNRKFKLVEVFDEELHKFNNKNVPKKK